MEIVIGGIYWIKSIVVKGTRFQGKILEKHEHSIFYEVEVVEYDIHKETGTKKGTQITVSANRIVEPVKLSNSHYAHTLTKLED
jgi:Holliday junction resolvasome RuvABC DNA-binding subunit